jgi:hypothetical protein
MSRLSPNEIAYVAAQQGWTGDDLITAVAVAMAESNGDPDALGQVKLADGTYAENTDHGLWQISNRWHAQTADGKPGKLAIAGGAWRDPLVNAGLARQVFDEFVRMGKASGWEAWQVYLSGSYKTYIPDAEIAVQAPWSPEEPDDVEAAVRKVLGQLDNRP